MVLVISSELKAPLMAADKPAADAKSGTYAYDGKVVVVDRAAKTITVEIQKRLYLFKFAPNTTVVRGGKKIKIEDLVAGQQITMQLIQTNDGQVQIGSLDVVGGNKSESAGNSGTSSGTPTDNSGSSSAPQPANGAPKRPNVSPYN